MSLATVATVARVATQPVATVAGADTLKRDIRIGTRQANILVRDSWKFFDISVCSMYTVGAHDRVEKQQSQPDDTLPPPMYSIFGLCTVYDTLYGLYGIVLLYDTDKSQVDHEIFCTMYCIQGTVKDKICFY